MRFLRFSTLIIVALFALTPCLATEINIIPKPKSVKVVKNQDFTINSKTKILYSEESLEELASLLGNIIYTPTAIKLETKQSSKAAKNSILLAIDPTIENREGYTLNVNSKGVIIKGGSGAGLFYGIQSLMQLLPPQIESDRLIDFSLRVPGVEIVDEPQFQWRGVMFDVGRYFFPKKYILRFIDMMAMYKMNTLHLHLVDDSGWRLEIKKYPLLTSIGGFNGEGEDRRGGFYTQEDIKEMVAYGQLRGVEIIPELEFPAHILSAVVAYPWLSCREEQLKMPTQHYISKDLICVGKQSSLDFLEDVIAETCELFPSKYIHVGGDEAVYDYWEECPHCQKVMKDHNLTKTYELQSYLTNQVAEMAAKHGRTLVGWDEILERGKVDHKVVSMIWRDMKGVDNVFKLGHQAILAPADFIYFDFPESRLPGEIKAATWKGPISVEKCYNFSTAEFENNEAVVGLEACMWSDQFIHGTILQELSLLDENRAGNYIEYLMLPRMLALSEISWTPSSLRNFEEFSQNLHNQYERLSYADFHFRVPTPIVKSTKVENGYKIELSADIKDATIYYTTNGQRPTTYDKVYSEPVVVSQLSDLRAIAALSKTHHSVATFYQEDYSKFKEYGTFVSKVQHSSLNKGSENEVTVDLTGKVSSNGDYELTVVSITDGVEIKVLDATVLKRNEVAASFEFNGTLQNNALTQPFSISEWQAGTPYSAKINLKVAKAHNGNIAVFIKKK